MFDLSRISCNIASDFWIYYVSTLFGYFHTTQAGPEKIEKKPGCCNSYIWGIIFPKESKNFAIIVSKVPQNRPI